MKSGRLRRPEAPALAADLRTLVDALPFPAMLSAADESMPVTRAKSMTRNRSGRASSAARAAARWASASAVPKNTKPWSCQYSRS